MLLLLLLSTFGEKFRSEDGLRLCRLRKNGSDSSGFPDDIAGSSSIVAMALLSSDPLATLDDAVVSMVSALRPLRTLRGDGVSIGACDVARCDDTNEDKTAGALPWDVSGACGDMCVGW